MPFIVTTTHLPEHDGATGYAVPTAFATREEAQAEQDRLLAGQGHQGGFILSTGTVKVGPLPDGTVIEVRPVQYQTLADLSGVLYRCPGNDEDRAAAVATFNAKHSPASRDSDLTGEPS